MYEATCFTCVFISGNLTHKSSFRAVNAQKFDTFQLQQISRPSDVAGYVGRVYCHEWG